MAPDAYETLCARYERISALGDARTVLVWDQQTKMPEGGTPARSKQLSVLSSIRHEQLTDSELGDLLDELDRADLDSEQEAVVRAIRYDHERAVAVPSDLVEKLTRAGSDAQEIWQDAKASNDFARFAPTLEELRELRIERAQHIDPEKPPYEVLYEDGEPHISFSTVERVFDTLRSELSDLLAEIRDSDVELADPFEGEYDEETQAALSEDVLDMLGYEWAHGRLDPSPHPITLGNPYDCRVTTRYDESNPLSALTSTVHEFGHATYQLGLPREHYGSPLAEAPTSRGVSESQSRFWENHVARTEPFCELLMDPLRERFPRLSDTSAREVYEAINRVYPDNVIRTQSDELTYHFHIMFRSEIERAYVGGEIGVEEIPQVWNEKIDEYLGVTPETEAEGPLQDIHWTLWFGGFEGYTLGSVLAAQFDAALREDVDDVDGKIRRGEFEPLREWLTENVHSHGKRYTADQLVEEATGEPLTAEYFVEYAREKFSELYDL